MAEPMKISLDHDGTFTKDEDFWRAFITLAKEHGHIVHIVTLRSSLEDHLDHSRFPGADVIYTSGRPKKDFGDYDIWIEDDPRCINEGSRLTPEQLAAWRKQDGYRHDENPPAPTASRHRLKGRAAD